MVKKEEKVLTPIMEENNPEVDFSGLLKDNSNQINDEQDIGDIINLNANNDKYADTFFKKVIEELFSKDNISLKTEYLNEDEQFTGTKLDFLTKECGFHMGKQFMPTWEEKRVSLQRKSRQEIVMGLWERQKEIRALEEREKFRDSINM